MKKLILSVLFLCLGLSTNPVSIYADTEDYPLEYRIVKVDNISISDAKRLRYRVMLGGIYNDTEATIVLSDIISKHHTHENKVNAIKFFIYFPGSDPMTSADGSIDWAPYGEWIKASSVRAGEYSKFKFKVNFYKDEEGRIIQEMAMDDSDLGNEVIGTWIESGFGTVSIVIKEGKPYLVRKFSSGGSMEQELVEIPSAKGQRFDIVSGNGEYVLINRVGELLFLSEYHDGVITLTKAN